MLHAPIWPGQSSQTSPATGQLCGADLNCPKIGDLWAEGPVPAISLCWGAEQGLQVSRARQHLRGSRWDGMEWDGMEWDMMGCGGM